MRLVSGEPLTDVGSFCPGGDEDPFRTRRIAWDRGFWYTRSGGARPSVGRLGRRLAPNIVFGAAEDFDLISIGTCHER